MLADPSRLILGLGLIGIGRPWPDSSGSVISESAAVDLIELAIHLGVTIFDTAPAYGSSEERLGKALRSQPSVVRESLTLCTKFGESWSAEDGSAVDHSVDAGRKSLDRSLERLGRVDVFQIHKCDAATLADDRLMDWLTSVRADKLIGSIGASVSTAEALDAALSNDAVDTVQFPANVGFATLLDSFIARTHGVFPIINRPMASGKLAAGSAPFEFLTTRLQHGVVLSGTTSPDHLRSNVADMKQAQNASTKPS